ncbi:cyclase family protein [Aureibaculum sp. 2210JD6-5]|uniref:cyclase family protein n=1 Tax=Aureibaculum sp. 2210JD6-5 TaxID=3103957 RepID=UPI002AAD2304|nr:cyclase family protein [Aureibaculum sp. 2210JD6-5]MDY7395875.1 cyclase family protein [Aureibaculum sp. 2210JD6-5]
MLTTIQYGSQKLKINLSEPIDISIPLLLTRDNVGALAWSQKSPRLKKMRSVKKKHSINFNSIYFKPHAHGTHTECVGHITHEFISVNKTLKQFFFLAEVVSVAPEKIDGDFVISKKQMQFVLGNKKREAIIIRTLPNTKDKLKRNYSKTNPPYLLEEAVEHLKEKGIEHLLIDLPSIDREKDGGKMLAHNAFWNTKGKVRKNATITEMIFVPNNIKDGKYFINIQIAPFENNASPSKPILYEVLN